MSKPRVAIVYHSYLPSEFAMGPVSAIKHLTDVMGQECDITLLTPNHDFLTGKPLFPDDYHVVSTDTLRIEYLPRGVAGLKILSRRLRERHDVVEIHSGFDRHLAIPAMVLARLGLVNAGQIFHSPHGIFLPIDMSRGAFKKRLYCALADATDLYRNVVHLASSPGEIADIRRWHRRHQRILEIPHFVDLHHREHDVRPRDKAPQSLKIAFVGRVTLQKNLLFAIDVVRRLGIASEMDVFGDADPDYQPACEAELAKGTGRCKVRLRGQIPQKELFELLPDYDVLFHPTLGENFGYSIFEAVSTGVPVLLSDKSPWLDVEQFGAGWALPLTDPAQFVARLTQIHAMGPEWQNLRTGALRYASEKVDNARSADIRRRLYAGELEPIPDNSR